MLLFLYTLRMLRARIRYTLPVLALIGATTAITTALLATQRGFEWSIEHAGDPQNAMVLSAGDRGFGGSLRPTLEQEAKAAPGVQSDGNISLVSPEFVLPLQVKRKDGVYGHVTFRGVDEVALKVHPAVRVEGALPARGSYGLVLGKGLLDKYVGFQPGQVVTVGRRSWPVTGILTANGTKYESEVWCDRATLMSEAKASQLSLLVAKLTDGSDAQAQFAARFAKNRALEVMSEPAFLKRQLGDFETYLRIISGLMLVLAIGAVLGSSNAMHASFLSRQREFGVLMSIGFTRGRIISLVLQESLLLSLGGGILGLAASLAVQGRQFTQSEAGLSYAARIDVQVLCAGAMIAIAIGVVSALVAIVQALRMNALAALSGD